jgi:ATP-binding cassette subfamily B protein
VPPAEAPVVTIRERAAGIARAMGLVWRSSPALAVCTTSLTLAQGVLPLAALWLLKLVVDAVTQGIIQPDKDAAMARLAPLLLAWGGVLAASAAASALSALAAEAQGIAVSDAMLDAMNRQSIRMDLAFYENSEANDALRRAQSEAPFRPLGIVNGVAQVLQNSVSLVGIAGMVLAFHWVVGAVIILVAVPGMALRAAYSRRLYVWARGRTKLERRASYWNWLLCGEVHAKELRLNGLGPSAAAWWMEARRTLKGEKLAIVRARATGETLAQVAGAVVMLGAFGIVARRAVGGEISLGDLVLFYQAFQRGQAFLQSLLAGIGGLYGDSLFLRNVFEFLAMEPTVRAPETPVEPPRPLAQGVELRGVTFRYPGFEAPVLRDLTLRLPAGRVVALVGANGAGKSTVVKLLARLYDPDMGAVTMDGVDLRSMDPDALRHCLAVVVQEPTRYQASLRENIRMGCVDLAPDDPRILEAGRLAGLDGIAAGLADGYETHLGRALDDGAELSGGQWQRVALARAIVRQADLTVLDEPTSAMDPLAEAAFHESFRAMLDGRAALIVSHRFSTVRMADHIYVLEDGAVVEEGSHDELLARNGAYAVLFEAQASRYR